MEVSQVTSLAISRFLRRLGDKAWALRHPRDARAIRRRLLEL